MKSSPLLTIGNERNLLGDEIDFFVEKRDEEINLTLLVSSSSGKRLPNHKPLRRRPEKQGSQEIKEKGSLLQQDCSKEMFAPPTQSFY